MNIHMLLLWLFETVVNQITSNQVRPSLGGVIGRRLFIKEVELSLRLTIGLHRPEVSHIEFISAHTSTHRRKGLWFTVAEHVQLCLLHFVLNWSLHTILNGCLHVIGYNWCLDGRVACIFIVIGFEHILHGVEIILVDFRSRKIHIKTWHITLCCFDWTDAALSAISLKQILHCVEIIGISWTLDVSCW